MLPPPHYIRPLKGINFINLPILTKKNYKINYLSQVLDVFPDYAASFAAGKSAIFVSQGGQYAQMA